MKNPRHDRDPRPARVLSSDELRDVLGGEGTAMPAARGDDGDPMPNGTPLPGILDGTPLPG